MQEGNVFSRVCLSVSLLNLGGSHVTVPMMHRGGPGPRPEGPDAKEGPDWVGPGREGPAPPPRTRWEGGPRGAKWEGTPGLLAKGAVCLRKKAVLLEVVRGRERGSQAFKMDCWYIFVLPLTFINRLACREILSAIDTQHGNWLSDLLYWMNNTKYTMECICHKCRDTHADFVQLGLVAFI